MIPGDYTMERGLEGAVERGAVLHPRGVTTSAWLAGIHLRRIPTFNGFYVTGSWVVSGETRRDDRTWGYARRVMPRSHWGAPELVRRYGRVDLNDGGITGGAFDADLGVNWWATRRVEIRRGVGSHVAAPRWDDGSHRQPADAYPVDLIEWIGPRSHRSMVG